LKIALTLGPACAICCSVGHEVDEAADGPAALSLAASVCPDVVLLDIGLPGMGLARQNHRGERHEPEDQVKAQQSSLDGSRQRCIGSAAHTWNGRQSGRATQDW